MSAATGWIRLALQGSEDALRDDALPPSAQREAAALIVLIARTLVSRRFATPRDRRVEPYARSLVAALPSDGPFTTEGVAQAIRAALGDVEQLQKLSPDQIVSVNLLLARAILAEGAYSTSQVDQVIAYAEAQLRSIEGLEPDASGPRRRRWRVPGVVARFAIVAAAITLVVGYVVAGFVTPGFLVADSSASQSSESSESYPDELKTYVTDLAHSIEFKDGAAFASMLCTTADPVESYIEQLGDVDSVRIDAVSGEDDIYTVLFEITSDGETAPAGWLAHLRREENQWCLSDLDELG